MAKSFSDLEACYVMYVFVVSCLSYRKQIIENLSELSISFLGSVILISFSYVLINFSHCRVTWPLKWTNSNFANFLGV